MSSTKKFAASLQAHESALAIQQKLADANPTFTDVQNELATSYRNIGFLLGAAGKQAEAMKAWESALAIGRKLAKENPESSEHASGLGASLNNMATIDLDARHSKRPASASDRPSNGSGRLWHFVPRTRPIDSSWQTI